MYQTSVILTIQSDSQAAVECSMRRLGMAGFQVLRSFDLKVARAAHVGCTCPHHGTDQCDCQLVVLLVYGQDEPPVSLVVHGHDGQAEIALVESTEQPPPAELVNSIRDVIVRTDKQAMKQGQKAANFNSGKKYHAG